jgi:succinate dehydrogenase / fumarate reductase cytochrome b subunit
MQDIKTARDVRPRNPIKAWFDVRKRNAGSWAFALNRLTGIGLTVYLLLHLIVLSLLLRGEDGWDSFLALARSPWFLALDVILIFGLLYHGLNGIRVALVGMGIAHERQSGLFWAVVVIVLIAVAVSAWRVYTI